MGSINQVILSSFPAALRLTTASHKLPIASHGDCKFAIGCLHAITDFCFTAKYRSHILQTIGYMNEYPQQFHHIRTFLANFGLAKVTFSKLSMSLRDWWMLRHGRYYSPIFPAYSDTASKTKCEIPRGEIVGSQ